MDFKTRLRNFASRHVVMIASVIILLTVLGIARYIFLKPNTDVKKDFRNVAVEVEEVRIGSLTRNITAVGTLMANQTVNIRPEINGLISEINVEGGEFLEKDAPLFKIDDRVFKAELKEAEARLAFAQVEYNRAKKLADSNFGSAQKLDDTKAKMLMAEATVESAKAKLERTVITAPFQGIIGLHTMAIGTPIGPDKEIATLVDITPIKVDFRIPAEFLRFISIGQRIDIKVDGFDKDYVGIIAGIDSKVDTIAHSINVRALMPNKNNTFKPGLLARVKIIVGSKDNTLIIPEVAIETMGDADTVYKVVEGLAIQVPVLTGIREGENVEILRGLNPGDHIIVIGQSKIRDGIPVRYELNGVHYTFNEADFKKKQQEMEEARKEESKDNAEVIDNSNANKVESPTNQDVKTDTSSSSIEASPAPQAESFTGEAPVVTNEAKAIEDKADEPAPVKVENKEGK